MYNAKYANYFKAVMNYHKAGVPIKRGPGRIPINASGEIMRARNIRMTEEEWAQCLMLGGAAWVRERIRRAYAKLK